MRINPIDLPQRYQDQINAQISNRNANTAPNVEPNSRNGTDAKKEAPRFNTPCSVCFHSVRKTLADIDGISGKAALDGIVHAEILRDDSSEYVKSVSHTQSKARKGEEEYTVITLESFDK